MPSLDGKTNQYRPWSEGYNIAVGFYNMGCGPSHFGISYSRKTKKKKNKHKESGNVY